MKRCRGATRLFRKTKSMHLSLRRFLQMLTWVLYVALWLVLHTMECTTRSRAMTKSSYCGRPQWFFVYFEGGRAWHHDPWESSWSSCIMLQVKIADSVPAAVTPLKPKLVLVCATTVKQGHAVRLDGWCVQTRGSCQYWHVWGTRSNFVCIVVCMLVLIINIQSNSELPALFQPMSWYYRVFLFRKQGQAYRYAWPFLQLEKTPVKRDSRWKIVFMRMVFMLGPWSNLPCGKEHDWKGWNMLVGKHLITHNM